MNLPRFLLSLDMATVYKGGRLLDVGRNRLIVEKTVGQGAFGVVYKVRERDSGQAYALKDIHCKNQSAVGKAIQEINALLKMSHDNVLKVVAVDQYKLQKGCHVLILTEFCSGGNLNERLSRQGSHETNMKWMAQLASALSHLHEKKIVHRDLKPENVLLTETEDIKIGDFGLAREYLALRREDKSDDLLSFHTTYYMNSGVGTPFWMAPEVFSQHYTAEADVFSLGCIFYAILTRKYIIVNNGERYYGAFVTTPEKDEVGLGYAMARLSEKFKVSFSAKSPLTRSLREITVDALQLKPKDRPSARELCDRIGAIRSAIRLTPDETDQQPQTGGCC